MEPMQYAEPTQQESLTDSLLEVMHTLTLREINWEIRFSNSILNGTTPSTPTSDTGCCQKLVDLMKAGVSSINLKSIHERVFDDSASYDQDPVNMALVLMQQAVFQVIAEAESAYQS